MTETLLCLLAQINPAVGDIAGNIRKITAAYEEGRRANADIVITPELSVSGYAPEDMVMRGAYLDACMQGVATLAALTTGGPALIIGSPWLEGGGLPYNAALLLQDGKIIEEWRKYNLPNYGVFDEKRVFTAHDSPANAVFTLKGARIGVAVCEDMWCSEVPAALKQNGAEMIIAINASPYETGKHAQRVHVMGTRVQETGLPVIYVNQMGGQDETVFDGGSFAMDADGNMRAFAGHFISAHHLVPLRKNKGVWTPEMQNIPPLFSEEETIYSALVLGLRDYVEKNDFPGVVLGMSGGIDSALVAALAVDALGPSRVLAVMMPSPYTSPISLQDAQGASRLLGCEYKSIPIEAAMLFMGGILAPHIAGQKTDITDQNIQSRLRGIILMALSNTFGQMVVATGNKSEMATGYATLYGDMCGGYAAIKDVYKTLVYRLSRWRNTHKPAIGLGPAGPVMPERIITRAPSAELKDNQTDQDTLPPYDTLDKILYGLIEKEMSVAEIAGQGEDPAIVVRVLRMLRVSEYKRRQAPPGTKITRRAFGRDWRYPLTNGFQERSEARS
jgi:NAD+ synthase